ncbi:hypothetical protein B0H14DRAFT_2641671 [Mycena olivaceomarginata]|nr:hypothetical protein B0H14DRAFT_2641671 [Mycena olivaceomarginata]
MSTPLHFFFPRRGDCVEPSCQTSCAGFIYRTFNSQYSDQADDPKRKCLCGHYYLAHLVDLDQDPNDPALRRGANRPVGCGGFFKIQQVRDFDPMENCDYCHTPWLAHANARMSAAQSSRRSMTFGPGPAMAHAPGFAGAAGMAGHGAAASAFIPTPRPPNSGPYPAALSNSVDAPAIRNNPFHSNAPSQLSMVLQPASSNTQFSSHPPNNNPFAAARSSVTIDPMVASITVPERANPFARTSTLPPPAAAFNAVLPAIGRFQERTNSTGTVQTLRHESLQRIASSATTHSSPPRRNRLTNAGSSAVLAAGFPAVPDAGSSRDKELIVDAVPPQAGHHAYKICFLPFKSPGDTQYYRDGSPSFHGYTICTHTALPGLLRALAQYNLCTTVRISSEKNLWSQINAHAQDFLPKKSIVLVSPRHDLDAEASAWELRGWDLLAFRGPNPATNRQLTIHGAMGRQWTFAELSKVAKRCIHPDFDHIELLFVAPRYGNLSGPIHPWEIAPHPCLPWRAYWTLLQRDPDDDNDAGCIPGCPNYDDGALARSELTIKRRADSLEASIEAEPKRLRTCSPDDPNDFPPPHELFQHSPPLLPAPLHIRNTATQGVHDETIEIDSESEDDQDGLVREIISAEPNHGSTSAVKINFNEFTLWRTRVYDDIGNEDSLVALSVCGPNVESIALALHGLIHHIHEGHDVEQYQAPADIILRPAFPSRFPPWPANVPRPEESGATGLGPERAVYVKGLALRLSDTRRWEASSKVIRPARVADFQLDGTWIALFLVEVGIGPDPLCPFFLLAISQRNRAWVASLTLGYIHSLDPSAARTLAPRFALKRTDVVKFPREKLHPGMEVALQYLSINATEFTAPRDEETHDTMHLNLICQYFFGRDDPYQHPEFNGAHQGFNIALGKKKKQTMIGHCDLDSFKALVGGIYNRRIEQVEDILTRLQFRAPANFDKVEGLRRDIFQLRFLRWIRGVGYPRSVRGKFVSAKEFKAQRKNKLLRAEAFLYSMTGMHVIHPDPEFVLTIDLVRNFDDDGKKGSLGFHDCITAVEVLNSWTDNILLQDVDFDDLEQVTDFDHRMSSEFSLPHGDYNDS